MGRKLKNPTKRKQKNVCYMYCFCTYLNNFSERTSSRTKLMLHFIVVESKMIKLQQFTKLLLSAVCLKFEIKIIDIGAYEGVVSPLAER